MISIAAVSPYDMIYMCKFPLNNPANPPNNPLNNPRLRVHLTCPQCDITWQEQLQDDHIVSHTHISTGTESASTQAEESVHVGKDLDVLDSDVVMREEAAGSESTATSASPVSSAGSVSKESEEREGNQIKESGSPVEQEEQLEKTETDKDESQASQAVVAASSSSQESTRDASPGAPDHTAAPVALFPVGREVLAFYKLRQGKKWPGKVAKYNGNGTYSIHFSDGDYDDHVPEAFVFNSDGSAAVRPGPVSLTLTRADLEDIATWRASCADVPRESAAEFERLDGAFQHRQELLEAQAALRERRYSHGYHGYSSESDSDDYHHGYHHHYGYDEYDRGDECSVM